MIELLTPAIVLGGALVLLVAVYSHKRFALPHTGNSQAKGANWMAVIGLGLGSIVTVLFIGKATGTPNAYTATSAALEFGFRYGGSVVLIAALFYAAAYFGVLGKSAYNFLHHGKFAV